MHVEVLSLFPDYIKGPLSESILKRAIQKNLLTVSHHDIRDYSSRKDRRVDDRPFGGGPGMVLCPEPVCKAIRSLKGPDTKVIYLSPQGVPLSSSVAKELACEKHLIMLCGHYEGIDQRALDSEVDMHISIGDYVLTNGCLAALVVIDALARFIPGVLGDELASEQDSFEGGVLDCPHYTDVKEFEGRFVPEVLFSGDHERIRLWRRSKAVEATLCARPDLLVDTSTIGLCQVIEGTLFFEKTVRWYTEILGVSPQLTEKKATFRFGQMLLVFVEGEVGKSLLFFTVHPEQFQRARRYAERKNMIIEKKAGEGLSAFFRDPDGRTVGIQTFMKN